VDVCAPIAGTVWKVEVAPGDLVPDGGVVVVLESMKMEMPVESPSAGTVTRICVREGDAVEEGAVLVVLD
jgi:acetyl-CoA carboxylase biotin carboxyl carrier protein